MKPAPGQGSLFNPPSAREQYAEQADRDCFECNGQGCIMEYRTYGGRNIAIKRDCHQCGGTGKRPAVKLNPTVEPEDAPRLRKGTEALRRLMGTEWRTATQLTEWVGRRYGARLHELHRAGIPHETRRVAKGKGEFEFRLIGTPTNGLM